MSDGGLGSLSEHDVRQVALLMDSLGRSTFDYLQVEVGDLKLTIARGAPPSSNGAAVLPGPPEPPAASSPPATSSPTLPPPTRMDDAPSEPTPPPATASASAVRASSPAGTVAITAPIIGVFYAQPEPGAPPFVTVGTRVEPDTTVALVEVMKTFNAVSAGVSGTIVEICVENAQMVEFGQVLYRVSPRA